MDGNVYAYDVTVPASEARWIEPCNVTTILKDGVSLNRDAYYSFEAVAIGPEHYQMEKGWPRYQACLDNEKACRPVMLELAKRAYPELANVAEWPSLWVELPSFEATHETRYLDA